MAGQIKLGDGVPDAMPDAAPVADATQAADDPAAAASAPVAADPGAGDLVAVTVDAAVSVALVKVTNRFGDPVVQTPDGPVHFAREDGCYVAYVEPALARYFGDGARFVVG